MKVFSLLNDADSALILQYNAYGFSMKLFWSIETFLIEFETKKQNVQNLHTFDRPVEETFNEVQITTFFFGGWPW